MEPNIDQDNQLFLPHTEDAIYEGIARAKPQVLLLVNPTYEGLSLNLERVISTVRKKFPEIIIFVDEAWGAHLHFSARLPIYAMKAGADICVQSTHKQGGSLQQSGMIHWKDGRINNDLLMESYRDLGTSSPSYILLASLDAARETMERMGKEKIDHICMIAASLARDISLIDGFAVVDPNQLRVRDCSVYGCDQTKVIVNVSGIGLNGYDIARILERQFGIVVEGCNVTTLLFLVPFRSSLEDVRNTVAALECISKTKKTVSVSNVAPVVSHVRVTPDDGNSKNFTIIGNVTDPGTADLLTIHINWGDGSSTPLSLTAGSTNFSASHSYTLEPDPLKQTISVTATDSNGSTSASESPIIINPLTVSSQTVDAIALDWPDASPNATGYRIERSTDGSIYAVFVSIARENLNFQAGKIRWTDTDFDSGTRYYYRVRAYGNGEDTGYSQAVSTAFPTPTNLIATAAAANQINLTWDQEPGSQSGFIIYRSTTGAGDWVLAGTTPSNVETYSDTGVLDDQIYYYFVQATQIGGAPSDQSNHANATTPVGTPGDPVATLFSDTGKIQVTWADNSYAETGFTIHATDGTSTTDVNVAPNSTDTDTYTFDSLPGGAENDFVIEVHGQNGGSAFSNASYAAQHGLGSGGPDGSDGAGQDGSGNNASGGTGAGQGGVDASQDTTSGSNSTDQNAKLPNDLAYFFAPGNLQGHIVDRNRVDLTWKDRDRDEVGYILERSEDGHSWTVNSYLAFNATSYTNVNLSDNKIYFYRIRGFNSFGYTKYSNTLCVTTAGSGDIAAPPLPTPPTPPTPPTVQLDRGGVATGDDVTVNGNTITLGQATTSYKTTQAAEVRYVSIPLPTDLHDEIGIAYDLHSFDYYRGGTGGWDAFVASVTDQPFTPPDHTLPDHSTPYAGSDSQWVWGGAGQTPYSLSAGKGAVELKVPKDGQTHYLNLVLDTKAYNANDTHYASWGTLKYFSADVSVDSNNDGTINSDDPAIENDSTKSGVLISINDDDDNVNQTPDLNDTGPVDGENDLIPLNLSVWSGAATVSGTATLTLAKGGDKVKFYGKPDKTQPLTNLSWQAKDMPSKIWAEASSVSASLADITFQLSYKPDADTSAITDKANATAESTDVLIGASDVNDVSLHDDWVGAKDGDHVEKILNFIRLRGPANASEQITLDAKTVSGGGTVTLLDTSGNPLPSSAVTVSSSTPYQFLIEGDNPSSATEDVTIEAKNNGKLIASETLTVLSIQFIQETGGPSPIPLNPAIVNTEASSVDGNLFGTSTDHMTGGDQFSSIDLSQSSKINPAVIEMMWGRADELGHFRHSGNDVSDPSTDLSLEVGPTKTDLASSLRTDFRMRDHRDFLSQFEVTSAPVKYFIGHPTSTAMPSLRLDDNFAASIDATWRPLKVFNLRVHLNHSNNKNSNVTSGAAAAIVANANTIWSQAGCRFNISAVFNEATSDDLMDPNVVGFSEFYGQQGDVTDVNNPGNAIDVYFVDQIFYNDSSKAFASQIDGYTVIPNPTGLDIAAADPGCIIAANSWEIDDELRIPELAGTLAHELGHFLLNVDDSIHTNEPDWNLMRGGASINARDINGSEINAALDADVSPTNPDR